MKGLFVNIVAVSIGALLCFSVAAADASKGSLSVDSQWGGHLRTVGAASFIDDRSVYRFVETGTYFDAHGELRLKNQTYLGARWSLEIHYELAASGGDTRDNTSALRRLFPGTGIDRSGSDETIDDDRRFFDFTRQLATEDDYVVYHRLDRLKLSYTPSWGSLRLGRQALTWGNGMVFNPMDLFNPFSPASVVRDYKVGDDMMLATVLIGANELQGVYVPRRDPASGQLQDSQSSYAGNYHWRRQGLEMVVLAARHCGDNVAGWGASGYMGDAAWRADAVYTRVGDDYANDDFIQFVVNIDYAWVWNEKNYYGVLEYYYNGSAGDGDYAQRLSAPYIAVRLTRGDLFALGRNYLAGRLQIELHPLLQNNWTVIVNLDDPSGMVQPQLTWDITADLQLIAGAQWHWGAHGTEYGGFDAGAGGQSVTVAPHDRLFLWLTLFF